MSNRRIALIGIGNILFHDEGLGAYLSRYIELNYALPENLLVLEGSTLGFGLMTYYQEYDKIIVVGAGSHEGIPGMIHRENAQDVVSKNPVKKTANEVEITMMIEICSFHEDMGEVELITMVPEDIIEVKNGLTETILSKMPLLVESTLKVLEEEGIKLKKMKNHVSFEEIIEAYANPKVADLNPSCLHS